MRRWNLHQRYAQRLASLIERSVCTYSKAIVFGSFHPIPASDRYTGASGQKACKDNGCSFSANLNPSWPVTFNISAIATPTNMYTVYTGNDVRSAYYFSMCTKASNSSCRSSVRPTGAHYSHRACVRLLIAAFPFPGWHDCRLLRLPQDLVWFDHRLGKVTHPSPPFLSPLRGAHSDEASLCWQALELCLRSARRPFRGEARRAVHSRKPLQHPRQTHGTMPALTLPDEHSFIKTSNHLFCFGCRRRASSSRTSPAIPFATRCWPFTSARRRYRCHTLQSPLHPPCPSSQCLCV